MLKNCKFPQLARLSRLALASFFSAALAACGGGEEPPESTVVVSAAASPLPVVQATWKAANWNVKEQTGTSPTYFSNQTLRMKMRLSAAGNHVRIRVTNEYGVVPLFIDSVHIAATDGVGTHIIKPATDTVLTFGGSPKAMIAAGQTMESDFVPMTLPAFSTVAVSMYLASPTWLTAHQPLSLTTNYVGPGNQAAASSMVSVVSVQPWYLIRDIEVINRTAVRTVVAIGDSITLGVASSKNSNRRWVDLFANKLLAYPGSSVVNVGIGSGRLLNDGTGPSVLHRFDRDVLQTKGVTHTIIAIGINDIGYASTTGPTITASQMIAGLKNVVAQAKAHNIKPYLATITPFQGAAYYSANGEQIRQVVNNWIRGAGTGAYLIDFDKAVRDPTHPARWLPAYSAEHLHPNDIGHEVMANAINPALFQ